MPRHAAACLLMLASLLRPAAAVEASVCDDAAAARAFKARYPSEVEHVFDTERRQQAAWAARAQAIAERVVAVGAATREAQDALRLTLAKSPQVAALDARAQGSADEFRLRNNLLRATPILAGMDPLHPDLAWCLLARQALDALDAKLSAEAQAWALIDRALLDAAAARGVVFAN